MSPYTKGMIPPKGGGAAHALTDDSEQVSDPAPAAVETEQGAAPADGKAGTDATA